MEIEKQIESCPISMPEYPLITLAHGGGGLLSQKLFEQVFLPAFENEYLREAHDGAALPHMQGAVQLLKAQQGQSALPGAQGGAVAAA